MRRPSALALAAAWLLAAFALAYVPDTGRGFIKDDFAWIETSRVASIDEAGRLLRHEVGFYRPIVAASFALNYAAAGMSALSYGLTNFVLAVAAACLVFAVARALALPPVAALVAAGAWAFNLHGVSMAVLWISGRTSLLLCIAALAAALSALRGRRWTAAVWCLLAMLCKEEAVVLPFVLAAFAVQDRPSRERLAAAARAWPLFVPLAAYAALRMQTAAFGFNDAPPYYQPTVAPGTVLRNASEYLDRAGTVPVLVAVVLMVAARALPRLDRAERRVLAFGALWFAGGYAFTVFLPVRSSLYALYPGIGACLALAAVVSALVRTRPQPTARALTVLALVPLLLLPVYRARNARWVGPAELSAQVLRDVAEAAGKSPDARRIILIDDPDARATLDSAFGGLFQDAVVLTLGPGYAGEIVRVGSGEPPAAAGALALRLRNGRLATR